MSQPGREVWYVRHSKALAVIGGTGWGFAFGGYLVLFGLGASMREPADFLRGAYTGAILMLHVCVVIVLWFGMFRENRRRFAKGLAGGVFACFLVLFLSFVAARYL